MRLQRAWGRNQSGEGKIALFLGIAVVVAVIYFLKLAIPPRIEKAEMTEFIENQTRSYVVNQISFDQLQKGILEESARIGIPLKEENLNISDAETRVQIKASYDLVQKLVGGKEWVQHHEIEVEIPRL